MSGWRQHPGGCDSFWVESVPTNWPRPGLWTDVTNQEVIDRDRSGSIDQEEAPLGVVYAPPVPAAAVDVRARALNQWRQAGVQLVVQVIAGESGPSPEADLTLWDPTNLIAMGKAMSLPNPPPGVWVIWPLMPDVSDGQALDRFVDRPSVRSIAGIVPLAPRLSAQFKRKLVDGYGAGVFEALHHGAKPNVAAAARTIHQHHIFYQPVRPRRTHESDFHGNACSTLGCLGDLLIRLGEEERGQRILRAVRWLEQSPWDLNVIIRDGHLPVIEQLGGETETVLQELSESGASALLASIREKYLASG